MRFLLRVGLITALAAIALSLLGTRLQLAELLRSIWPQIAFGLAGLGAVALLMKHFFEGSASLVLAAALLAQLAPHYDRVPTISVQEAAFSVVWMNIHHHPQDLIDVAAWAEAKGAALLLIGEPMAEDITAPTGWVRVTPACSFFVEAFVRDGEVVACSSIGRDDRRSVSLRLTQGNQSLDVVGIHATAPFVPQGVKNRQHEFRMIAEKVTSNPTLLIGDLNTIPWSGGLEPFQTLKFQRVPTGGQATWLSPLPFIGLPIDHGLYRGPGTASAELGPWLRSDHRPLLITAGK
ncbi:MAG: endonuclease/exonuclease/phosphatase family protein [Parvularculaceae bacterium]|nr:endonuclease/exonuclease/phosphatase family protein [Parvularculaceae bacterium]